MNININDIYKKKIIEICTDDKEVFTLGKFYEHSGTVERILFFGPKSAFIVHFSFNIYRYFRQNNTSSYRVILIIKK